MKAYKGFNKLGDGTLNCRGFAYEVGKTYKHEGPVEVCKSGFHACHELHQCWQFYPNNGENAFYEVECGGEIVDSEYGEDKFACSEIIILREVDMSGVAVFDWAGSFLNGYAWVRKGDKYNHISTDGKFLSDEWWDYSGVFHNGYAVVNKDGKYNHIGTDGKFLSDEWWDGAWSFYEGYAKVYKDGKYNHISTDGKFLSDEWWNDAYSFHNGYAKVYKDGKYNHISTDGKFLSDEWWNDAYSFHNGYAMVRKDGKNYKIDTNGNVTEC